MDTWVDYIDAIINLAKEVLKKMFVMKVMNPVPSNSSRRYLWPKRFFGHPQEVVRISVLVQFGRVVSGPAISSEFHRLDKIPVVNHATINKFYATTLQEAVPSVSNEEPLYPPT